jgi:hypothetical protein
MTTYELRLRLQTPNAVGQLLAELRGRADRADVDVLDNGRRRRLRRAELVAVIAAAASNTREEH